MIKGEIALEESKGGPLPAEFIILTLEWSKGRSLPADLPFTSPHGLGVIPETPRSEFLLNDVAIENAPRGKCALRSAVYSGE